MSVGTSNDNAGSPLVAIVTFAPRTAARAIGAGARMSGSAADAMFTRAEPVISHVLRRVVEVMPIEAVLARVDINALVGQVDVDAIVRRVDVEALITRLDLPSIIGEVLGELQLGDLIQDSTTGIAADVRDSMRVRAIRVDGGLAAVIDRVLMRRRPRDLAVPGLTPGLAT
jgi:hypothetical protein